MGLGKYFQREAEINELKRRNAIEAKKLQLMEQEQKSGKEKLKYCPHCGKPLP
jgi:hypothetical protein